MVVNAADVDVLDDVVVVCSVLSRSFRLNRCVIIVIFIISTFATFARSLDEIRSLRDVDATHQENVRLTKEVDDQKKEIAEIKKSRKQGAEKRALRSEAALERERQKNKKIRLEKKSTYNLLR